MAGREKTQEEAAREEKAEREETREEKAGREETREEGARPGPLTRREMKAAAKKVLKRHYKLFVLLCMVISLMGGELAFSGSVWRSGSVEAGIQADSTLPGGIVTSFTEFMRDIRRGDWEGKKRRISEAEERYAEETAGRKGEIFGRSRGVFALIANKISSGSYLMTVLLGIRSFVGTDSAAVAVMLLGALFLLFFVRGFVVGVFRTAVLRMFLEGRLYEKVPLHRAWFLVKVRKWFHVGLVQTVTGVFSFLWSLTIAGGFVKYYSYYLVPCILAENPAIKARDAITLSRRLMKGHKWECFVLELSFLGWGLLGIFTLGISDVLFQTPYKAAVLGEYYAQLRRLGREAGIPEADRLNDLYLFEQADRAVLWQVYGDVEEEYRRLAAEEPRLKGTDKLLARVFGVSAGRKREFDILEEEQSREFRMEDDKKAAEGLIYPTRLHPIPEKEKRSWLAGLNYLRFYSVWSLLMMFFVLSFAGWLWEVSLHLITEGELVNRGVLHGPWLPIYGSGSVLILVLLHSYRRKPALEFVLAVALCGTVEYFTSLCLEIANDGIRWWDYTGYFLNLNGRICAEGLLVFGIGGMGIVYVLAPFLDVLFRRIPEKILIGTTVVLLLIFGADQLYSMRHPNQGEGITSGEADSELEGKPEDSQGGQTAETERKVQSGQTVETERKVQSRQACETVRKEQSGYLRGKAGNGNGKAVAA